MHETPAQALLSLFPPPPPFPRESLLAGYMQVQEALRGKYRHRTLDAFLLGKGKEREGFIKPNWCGRVLRLSIPCYYKTYIKILIVCFFFVWAYACISARHACVTGEE